MAINAGEFLIERSYWLDALSRASNWGRDICKLLLHFTFRFSPFATTLCVRSFDGNETGRFVARRHLGPLEGRVQAVHCSGVVALGKKCIMGELLSSHSTFPWLLRGEKLVP